MPRRKKSTPKTRRVRGNISARPNSTGLKGQGWVNHGDGLYSRTRGLPEGVEEHFDSATRRTGFFFLRGKVTRFSFEPVKIKKSDLGIFYPHETVLSVSFQKGVSPLGKSKEAYRQEAMAEAREMVKDFRWLSDPNTIQWFRKRGFVGITSLTRNTAEITFLKRHFPVVVLPSWADARVRYRRMLDRVHSEHGIAFSKYVENPFWNVYIRFEWLNPRSAIGKKLNEVNAKMEFH